MKIVELGNSGLKVSKICFGTLTMSPLQKNMEPQEGARLLTYAYERGVRFLDTADLYANYDHIRIALSSCPDYVVSTKAYCWDEPTASAALERAYRGLGRDYVDLFMLHEQESLYTLRGHEEALNYLEKQRQAGHIGAVGISTHFSACVKAASRFPVIRVVHPLINIDGIGIQDGTRQDMESSVKHTRAFGVGIFAMKPLGGGHLLHNAKEAMHYALTSPLIDSVAVGMQSFEEIDANIAIAEGREDDFSVSAQPRHMMVHDYCEGCGRCAERCRQKAITIKDGRAHVDESKCVFCGYCARVCPQFCIKVI